MSESEQQGWQLIVCSKQTMTCKTSAKTGREMIWKHVLFLKLLFFNRENLSGPFLIHNKEQVEKKERANEGSEAC